jgi:hypothetical protein
MNDTIYQLKRRMRQGLAAILFTLLLFGASAAALSALAAGITALSGMRGSAVVVAGSTQQVSPTTSSTATESTGVVSKSIPQGGSQPASAGGSGPSEAAGGSYVDDLNRRLDHMQSPIGETLDSGGVALGAKVQQTFGRVLSGVLETLFFERNQPASQTGGQP